MSEITTSKLEKIFYAVDAMTKECLAERAANDKLYQAFKKDETLPRPTLSYYEVGMFFNELIEEYLKENGFEQIGSGCFSIAFKGTIDEKEIVIKYSLCDNGTGFPEPSELAQLPFLEKRTVKPLLQTKNVLAQPVCKTNTQFMYGSRAEKQFYKAHRIFKNLLVKLYGSYFDCHYENVGILNGKMMTFDPNLAY